MDILSEPLCLLIVGAVGVFFFSLCFISLEQVGSIRAKKLSEDGRSRFSLFGHHPLQYWTALTILKSASVVCLFAGGFSFLSHFLQIEWLIWLILGVSYFLLAIFFVRLVVHSDERKIAEKLLPLMHPFVTLCRPVSWIVELVAVKRQEKEEPTEPAASVERIEEEIEIMLDESEKQGMFNTLQGKMLRSAIDFDETMVREVMAPRTALVACPLTATFEEALRLCVEEGYSRLPVYGENIDDIVGVLYFKDLMLKFFEWEKNGKLNKYKSTRTVKQFMRTPYFIPETNKINDVFKEFQQKHVHIAIVIDEFGGTAGIVTLEDLMEEVFGEIQDEYDSEASAVQILDKEKQHAIIDAKASISEINDLFDKEFEEGGDYDSVGGLVSMKLGHVGSEGETVDAEGLRFTVTKANERCILEVRVDVLEMEPSSDSSEES